MRLILLHLTVVTIVVNLTAIRSPADDGLNGPRESVADDEHVRTDWTLLRFSDDRNIRKATIVMKDLKDFFGPDRFRPDGERIEITERKLLDEMRLVFSRPPLSMAEPDDGLSGGGWGTVCFGRLEIETTNGESFFVAMSFVGFHLNLDAANTNNVFWSGALARMIDEIYSAKYKKHITYKSRSLAELHAGVAVDIGGFAQELRFRRQIPKDD